ncbi:MAG: hypothetical protein KGH87_08360 [Thaumarchaeota archaeon]|nr:hypothetical protein [Nitrososphaerota archaeon]
MDKKWYIVTSSCESCGGDTDIVGPFDTEKEAYDFSGNYGGTGVLWKGPCSNRKICQITSPEEVLQK